MRSIKHLTVSVLVLSLLVVCGAGADVLAGQPVKTGAQLSTLSLSSSSALGAGLLGQDEPEEEVVEESTTVTTTESGGGYTLEGPYFLRSADTLDQGEMELKFIYKYETSSGPSDSNVFEIEFEWGITDKIELIAELPIELGDGRVTGNGDLHLGLQTHCWEEDGALPAFSVRNMLRIPTGYHSSGVDWIARGIFTKTITDTMRFHANPWLELVNGHNEEDARHFQWGVALGMDYKLADNLIFVWDYQHANGELDGTRNNHQMEFGLDWAIAEKSTLGLSTIVGLDGDDEGANWGMGVSYIMELGS